MRLTQFSDYSLRVLIYVGHKRGLATVVEIAESFHISRNHLVKVVHHLAGLGLIRSYKGRGGGIELACDPATARIGDLIEQLEPDLDLVECFNKKTNECPIIGICDLEHALYQARAVFLAELNKTTLKDLYESPRRSAKIKILGIRDAAATRRG